MGVFLSGFEGSFAGVVEGWVDKATGGVEAGGGDAAGVDDCMEQVINHIGGVSSCCQLGTIVVQIDALRWREPEDKWNLDVGVGYLVRIVVAGIVALVVDILAVVGEID